MAGPTEVRAWDLPTRVFKWSLVVLVVAAPLTRWYGDDLLVQHKFVGYFILTLLLWRLMWGVVGGATARFAHFVPSPPTSLRYAFDMLRGRETRYLGHNPLGAWMVLAFLLVLGVQATTGLFANDSIINEGPLRNYVSEATSSALTGLHHRAARLLLLLIVIHIAANLFHTFVKRDNLIGAMVTGRKPALPYADMGQSDAGSIGKALVCLAIAVAIVFGGLALFGQSPFR